jgi:hypothetical protein
MLDQNLVEIISFRFSMGFVMSVVLVRKEMTLNMRDLIQDHRRTEWLCQRPAGKFCSGCPFIINMSLVRFRAVIDVRMTGGQPRIAWETFRLVDQGDCTYAIQTVSGYYLGLSKASSDFGVFSTDISDINYATKFRLSMFFLE